MSLAVEFVAAAADVGAAFVVVVVVVVVAVVAAVAACIKTFVAVVLGPSSLFPSLLSLSQNLSLPFLSDTQWFLIHLPFFLELLHHSSSSRSFQGLATKANRTRVSTPSIKLNIKQHTHSDVYYPR